MILNTTILIITGLIFAGCGAAFIKQIICSLRFRRKIAYTHGFSEGILTGIAYPAVIFIISLIFIQFVSFFIFTADNEFITVLRLTVFFLSVFMFFFFQKRTPPLLAYWFGKSAFWENYGVSGKIKYTEIYGARVSRKVKFPVMNNQQLCKVSFCVRGKTAITRPNKYVCRLTAYELTALATQVQFHPSDYRPEKPSVLAHLPFILLPYLVFLTVFSFTLPIISTGVLNPYRYSLSDSPLSEEIETVTSITDLSYYNNKLYVYYGNIGAINVYSTRGEFIYAISFPYTALKVSDFSVSNGFINFRSGNTVYTYMAENGVYSGECSYDEAIAVRFNAPDTSLFTPNGDSYHFDTLGVHLRSASSDVTIIERPGLFALFDLHATWFFIVGLMTAVFILHYFTCDRPKHVKNVPETSMETSSVKSEINDHTSEKNAENTVKPEKKTSFFNFFGKTSHNKNTGAGS